MASSGVTGEIVEIRRSDRELHFEWRIPDILSLLSSGDFFESPGFSFGNGDWHIISWNSSWLKLGYRFPRERPRIVSISFSVRGSSGLEKRDSSELEIQSFGCWSQENFFSKSQLMDQTSGLVVDKAMIVTCEMKMPYPIVRDVATETDDDIIMQSENQTSEKQAVEELQKSLQSLLASQEGCDVVIKVKDKEFPAHRLILGARSLVFRAMFTHDMVERQGGVVTLEDCDPETVQDFLDHIYTGNTQMICARNVFGLYAASDKYDLKALKSECARFVKSNLKVSCFCDTIALAVRHSDRELIELVTEFFFSHSLDIVETAEWQVFLAENPTVGNELFLKLLSKHGNIFRGTC